MPAADRPDSRDTDSSPTDDDAVDDVSGVGALATVGWGARVAALVHDAADALQLAGGRAVPGRVQRVDNTHVVVQRADDLVQAPLATLPAEIRDDPLARPTTGDWVLLGPDEDEPPLVAVLERWSQLTRADALGRAEQALAADVDEVLVVHGLDRPLRIGRLERLAALALDAGAVPCFVLTKADLASPDEVAAAVAVARSVSPSIDVVVVSSASGAGLDQITERLRPDRTAVLLGESGAGKSSLVNALVARDTTEVGRVRSGDAKGRHTTTTRDLFGVPGGGVLIDTPGLRAVGLWESNAGIARLFEDLEDLADTCRFNDCEHQAEPGCALRAAVAAGDIDADRLERWLGYVDELDEIDALRAERERAASRGRRPRR